jgi:hypothetical protein
MGVVTRLDGKGGLFAYFFGPKRAELPSTRDKFGLVARDAIWKSQLGDLGLINGAWAIREQLASWSRSEWPLPRFVRIDVISGSGTLVEYTDALELVSETPCSATLAQHYPNDGVAGYGFVEIKLTKLLDP